MLPDGEYDAIVVDAEALAGGGMTVSLTLVSGAHKGEVVDVRTTAELGDPVGLLGIPAVLTVTEGVPTVVFEP